MKFNRDSAEIFIPDNTDEINALQRTTHLAIGAHQDDLEIMAAGPIIDCFKKADQWFSAVVVADGRGSPRNGAYAEYSDDEMRLVRFQEQRKAAQIGEYSVLMMLDYPSRDIKNGKDTRIIDDLVKILENTRPQIVYTHNLADKHDTHVGVALKTIAAIRQLPLSARPAKVLGCEVWRGLDWMVDEDKILINLSERENLQAALVAVFDSQISGGKRYDLAAQARRRANATYLTSHSVDQAASLAYAMDMTPLIQDDNLDPAAFIQRHIQRMLQEVQDRLSRLQ